MAGRANIEDWFSPGALFLLALFGGWVALLTIGAAAGLVFHFLAEVLR